MIPVVIPAKPLAQALGRLADVLSAEERHALQAAMLQDVLRAARAFSERVVVVTADAAVAELARAHRARVAPDLDPPSGINAAVRRGIGAFPGEPVLIVMGDLPCATVDDLRQVALAGSAERGITCAVSHDGTGTNAMLARPGDIVDPSFGPGSLARHLAAAARVGCDATVITAPGLMLDVDTPEDLRALCAGGAASSAATLVTAIGATERLTAATTG